jgi:V8-like Glu-specific endopeptidase
MCIPTKDIPAGMPGAQAQVAANTAQTVRVKTGYPTVGKFFFKVALMIRFNCTGSVIAADYKKPALVLVAAHCLFGNLGKLTYKTEDWSFAPGWHNNKAPFGTWTFTKGYYPASWPYNCILTHCDFNPRYDFALLVVKKLNGKHIGTVTGYDGWHINEPRTISVTIAGIPGNSSETLLSRTVAHTVDPGGVLARKASTPGFGDGSSGGPWFYKYFKKLQFGNELGDSGGYQNGGNSDSPSYSSFWKTNFSDFIAAVSKVDTVK